jgi:enamine deaminase RidA (YjgF/YER057c/UK114 family)
METISKKVLSLGHALPAPAMPIANFVPTVRSGNLLYVSGQIGVAQGTASHVGCLGATMDLETGYAAAQSAALSVLSHIAANTGDAISRVQRVLKLTVYVASTPEFSQHPQVANGASDLFVSVFGDAGKHARAAVGVTSLPRGAAVEVEAVVQIA